MKILISIPTFEKIYPETSKSIWNLDRGGHEVIFDFVKGYDCARARNNIAQKALDIGADYALMVDADNTLPEDALINLIEGKPKVALGYCLRKPRPDPAYDGKTSIYRLHHISYPIEDAYSVAELEELAANGEKKIRIHGGGAAIMLVSTDVFRKIHYPWFQFRHYASGAVLSEDLDFCQKCQENDIPVYVDCRVKCGHIIKEVR